MYKSSSAGSNAFDHQSHKGGGNLKENALPDAKNIENNNYKFADFHDNDD